MRYNLDNLVYPYEKYPHKIKITARIVGNVEGFTIKKESSIKSDDIGIIKNKEHAVIVGEENEFFKLDNNKGYVRKQFKYNDSYGQWTVNNDNKHANYNTQYMEKFKGKNVLIIDLETTGIPERKPNSPNDITEYYDYTDNSKYDNSRIVEIAWHNIDNFSLEQLRVKRMHSYVIKPSNFTIGNEKYHGISNEYAEIVGKDFKDVIINLGFGSALDNADYIVAHNAYFDVAILRNELYRIKSNVTLGNLNKLIENNRIICTGQLGRDICKLETRRNKFNKYKMPSLDELYKHYYGENPSVQHSALFDVDTTRKILAKIVSENTDKDEHSDSDGKPIIKPKKVKHDDNYIIKDFTGGKRYYDSCGQRYMIYKNEEEYELFKEYDVDDAIYYMGYGPPTLITEEFKCDKCKITYEVSSYSGRSADGDSNRIDFKCDKCRNKIGYYFDG